MKPGIHALNTIAILLCGMAAFGWFISSVRLDGRDVTGSGFFATSGKDSILDVTITNNGAGVIGRVRDTRNEVVPSGRLVLVPDPSLRANPMLTRTAVADSNGAFAFGELHSGMYTVIAFFDDGRFLAAFLRNPETIDRYERFGQPVHLRVGQVSEIDVTTVASEAR